MRLPVAELKKLTVDEVAETLRLTLALCPSHGERFVEAVLMDLQSWPQFGEMLDKNAWLAKLYG